MKVLLTLTLFFTINLSFAQDITSFPYFTGFEGMSGNLVDSFPAGWTSEDLNTAPYTNQGWQIIKNAPSSVNAHTDSTAVHMMSHFSEDNNDWLYTPSIQMTAGNTYYVSFWYSAKVVSGSFEKMKVHVGTANDAATMAATPALWDNDNINSDVYTEAIVEYTPTTSGIYYFGFHYYSTSFNFIMLVDDVTIRESAVGIAEETSSAFQLEGNPVEDVLRVRFGAELTEKVYAELYSMDGKLVQKRIAETGSTSLRMQVATLPKGIYYLKMYDEKQTVKLSEKIVLQ